MGGERVEKEEELVEGMQSAGESDADEVEYDEHVWLSLKNAQILTAAIADTISELDAEHRDEIVANSTAYTARLAELDAAYDEMVSSARYDTLVFGDRFPFRYLVDDYGLNYYAAFSGCSAEAEASFETILILAEKVDAMSLPAVLQIEFSDGSIARSIRDATTAGTQALLTVDSLQSVTAQKVNSTMTYLSAMQENLFVLQQALNG